jgi:hypothetical protein
MQIQPLNGRQRSGSKFRNCSVGVVGNRRSTSV